MYNQSNHDFFTPSITEFFSLILFLIEDKEHKIMYNVVVCIRISSYKWIHFTLNFTYYDHIGLCGEKYCLCLQFDKFIKASTQNDCHCLHGQWSWYKDVGRSQQEREASLLLISFSHFQLHSAEYSKWNHKKRHNLYIANEINSLALEKLLHWSVTENPLHHPSNKLSWWLYSV